MNTNTEQVELVRDSVLTVRVIGEIDISNVGELSDALDRAVEESPSGFVIDFTCTDYIDSAGIRAIAHAYHRIFPHGRLVLVMPEGNIRKLFYMIHIERVPGMFVCDTLSSAEQMLSSGNK